MSLKKFLASTALAATMATAPVMVPMAMAQDQMAQDQIDGAAIAAESDMVDAFIEAALAVNEVREGYMAQIEAEADQNAQMEMLEAADAAMLQAVEETPALRWTNISPSPMPQPKTPSLPQKSMPASPKRIWAADLRQITSKRNGRGCITAPRPFFVSRHINARL